LYYVMPHIAGETLRDRLEREGQLPLDEALEFARDVADALGYAHGQGVVHRDVKPENVLLVGGQALVADFGIARALKAAGGTRLTRTGMAIGTPTYMSPEQAAGGGKIDGRSDVYSLGCVLYELLAGTPPFTGRNPETIVRQHLSATPRPITDLRPTVPPNVSAAITRALAKAPADRYSQAAQFAQALITTGSVAQPLPVPPKRVWWVALPAMVVVVVATVLLMNWLPADRTPVLDRNRVVVVPFENRTGDSALALLGNLAADWVPQGLQEIHIIEVVPTATSIEPGPAVAGLAGPSEPGTARPAAVATRAGTVVAGAYYRRGDSIEFQTQVIDATEDRLLRAVAPVTGPAAASGAVLDSLRRRVVTTVASALDRRLMISTAASHPPSLEAYREYLEGHRAFYQSGPMRMREVLPHMYRAVALDSLFTDPRFFLVLAHANLGERRAADSNARLLVPFRPKFSPYQRAFLDWLVAGLRGDRVAALRAVRARGIARDIADEALKSNLPYEVIEILSNMEDLPAFYFRWRTLMDALHMVGDYSNELVEARRARAAYPDRLMMLNNELRALAALGRIDEVGRGLDESLLLPSQGEIDAWGLLLNVAAELRAHGDRENSIRLAERALDWLASRPDDEAATTGFRVRRALALYSAERWQAAGELFEELSAVIPHDVNIQGFLGVLAARRGDRDEALRISSKLEGMADPYDSGRDVYWQACVASQLGELDRAMVLLREAYARGRVFNPLLHRDFDLEPLHGYRPFEEFLKPKG
jgi:tetratricopeptide (TPR) repeat protein/TolB-like protein